MIFFYLEIYLKGTPTPQLYVKLGSSCFDLFYSKGLLSFLSLVWFSALSYLSFLSPHFHFSLVEMASDKSPYEMNFSDLNFKLILIYSYFSLSPLTTRNKMAVMDGAKTLVLLLVFLSLCSLGKR